MFSKMLCCLFMIAAMSLAGVAGCVEPSQPAPEATGEVQPAPETTDEVQPAILDEDCAVEPKGERSTLGPEGDVDMCCSWGYYRCPTTGMTYEFEALACSSGPSSTQAARACDNACSATCVKYGWFDPCP